MPPVHFFNAFEQHLGFRTTARSTLNALNEVSTLKVHSNCPSKTFLVKVNFRSQIFFSFPSQVVRFFNLCACYTRPLEVISHVQTKHVEGIFMSSEASAVITCQ